MGTNLDRFEPGYLYHVFKRSNNREPLFPQPANYPYFLEKYKTLLSLYLDTYAYCLIVNHFPLLVRIKDERELLPSLKKQQGLAVDFHVLVRQEFRKLFIPYATVFNKQGNHYGSLFWRPFKCRAIRDEEHFTKAIFYLHYNPKKHKVWDDFRTYPWSTYQSMHSEKPTLLKRTEVLDWFGEREAFIKNHEQPPRFDERGFIIE